MTRDENNHIHDENCGCGCGHDDEQDLIILVDEEGNEHSFVLFDMIEVDEQSYALLTAADSEDEDEEDVVYIFRMEDDENGEKQLVCVDDEEELEKVFAAWEALEEDWDDENDN